MLVSEAPEITPIPASILAIVAYGLVLSLFILRFKPLSTSPRGAWDLQSSDVTASSWGRGSLWLFLYRFLLFGWCFAIGAIHTANAGFRIFSYFTMWTWWLLTIYFGLSASASLRALRKQRSGAQYLDKLEYSCILLFHVVVAAVFIVDTMTWTVLVPMLRTNPDSEKVKWAERMFFNFYSYNTHGANAAFVMGELFLNSMPFFPYLMGGLGIYLVAFGLWAFTYFRSHGLWLYPFLDTSRSWAIVAYGGIFAGCFIAVGFVGLLFQIRSLLVSRVKGTVRVLKSE